MSGTTQKVLVIEDEKSLASALQLKLAKEGYEVGVAHDGKAALELMSHKHYDIALLDLVMPIMNGFEVLTAARKLPDPPIFIMLSNLTQPEDIERCIALGARKFLVKSDTSLAALIGEIKNL